MHLREIERTNMCGRIIIIIIIVKKKRRISIRIIIIILIRNGEKQEVPKTSFGDLIIRNGAKTISLQTSSGELLRNGANTIQCMSPKLCLGAIINGLYPSYPTSVSYDHSLALLLYCSFYVILPTCDSLWSFGVETNLYRIFIDCLGWKRICPGVLLLAWSGCESV